jgi:site-specific recombinase XerD
MNDHRAVIPTERADLAEGSVIPQAHWTDALDTFVNTLSSPRTARAYQRAVMEAMDTLGVDYVADVIAPDLARYRGGLVARMDSDNGDRLSPSTVNLKLAGLRQFLRSCLVTGITHLSKDAISFVLKSPRAEAQKPYEVLNESERRRLLQVAEESDPREHGLIALCLGAGLRVSELVGVRLCDFSQDEAYAPHLAKLHHGQEAVIRLIPLRPAGRLVGGDIKGLTRSAAPLSATRCGPAPSPG